MCCSHWRLQQWSWRSPSLSVSRHRSRGSKPAFVFWNLLDDTLHFIPPKSVIIQMMESHCKMLLSLSFARPNPKTKTTNTKGMVNIENSLNQAAWCRTHISNIMILPPTASQRPLCPSLHHILFAPYNCRFLLLRSPAILILVSGWFYLQFSSMACFLHDFGDSEKFGISTFRQHFPKHNLS